jgi:hypothetical protein
MEARASFFRELVALQRTQNRAYLLSAMSRKCIVYQDCFWQAQSCPALYRLK